MDASAFKEHAKFEQTHWWFLARREIVLRVLHQELPPVDRHAVLEIGCGTGGNVARLSNDYECLGVDISADAIDLAKTLNPTCEFLHYNDLREIETHIRNAKAVLLLDVLEHVADDFAFFSEVTSYLSPGSLLLITVPADPSLWSDHDIALFHYRRYTSDRLSKLWEGQPFTTMLMSGLNWRLAPIVRLARKLKMFNRRTRDPKSDLRMPAQPINYALGKIFASEANRLACRLRNDDPPMMSDFSGISMIAILSRSGGEAHRMTRPSDCPVDLHEPRPFLRGEAANLYEMSETPQ